MMQKRYILIGSLILIAIIGVVFSQLSRHSEQKQTENIATVKITSPFTHTSITPSVFYSGDNFPSKNQRAVSSVYSIFSIDGLKVQSGIANALQYGVPTYLRSNVQKNVTDVYVHLLKDSIQYTSASNFSFVFYVDSPEGWYRYTQSPTSQGNSQTTITPVARGSIK